MTKRGFLISSIILLAMDTLQLPLRRLGASLIYIYAQDLLNFTANTYRFEVNGQRIPQGS